MSIYRRIRIEWPMYFFTLVTYNRRPIFLSSVAREILRQSFAEVKKCHPFEIDAIVLLPDHLHCIWSFLDKDNDFSMRWNLIKRRFSYLMKKEIGSQRSCKPYNRSKQQRRESCFWQRRFWEHMIRNEYDYNRHQDYIYYNPVKHGYVAAPKDWQFSSFHQAVKKGLYLLNWGNNSDDFKYDEFVVGE